MRRCALGSADWRLERWRVDLSLTRGAATAAGVQGESLPLPLLRTCGAPAAVDWRLQRCRTSFPDFNVRIHRRWKLGSGPHGRRRRRIECQTGLFSFAASLRFSDFSVRGLLISLRISLCVYTARSGARLARCCGYFLPASQGRSRLGLQRGRTSGPPRPPAGVVRDIASRRWYLRISVPYLSCRMFCGRCSAISWLWHAP